MDMIVAAIMGGWGGSWSRWGEGWEINPPWCWVCVVVIGAVFAIIINILVGPQLGPLGFFERALLSFGSGVTGAGLIAGGLGLARGRGSAKNQ
jgi:hypothetical protein